MHPLELTDQQESEMLRLWRFYRKETERCRKAKAYLAGCVMAAATLETALLLMVNIYPEEARATGKLPAKNKPLIRWDLAELLRVAKAAGWLPSALDYAQDDWDPKKAQAGDYAEVVREIRNLTHPARYMLDHYGKRVTSKRLEWVLQITDAAISWLNSRVNKSLLEAMRAEGWVLKERERARSGH